MKKNILFVILILFTTSSCSLLKHNDWNSYKVTLEIRDVQGEIISGADIRSSARHVPTTDEEGRVSLYYMKRGLHIITVQSAQMKTKQVKIRVPDDANKIVSLYMQPR